jgi:hypothetical protein
MGRRKSKQVVKVAEWYRNKRWKHFNVAARGAVVVCMGSA